MRAWLIVPLSITGSATSPTSPEAPGVVSALLHRKREPAARAAAGRVRAAARMCMFGRRSRVQLAASRAHDGEEEERTDDGRRGGDFG